ncbi:N-acetylmuramoyl-L-alanine amidase family protein [Porphyromonas levii]|uniref:N-acetylmuramoyl-L-alanine amidase family protein n=1 Tax=Porphyromonas levii TaxID=28114 RepID=UPI001B8B302F|nr:N-acetylmuramoyl-L-alanine amidase [Porphyromonas levii]MBR8769226.1 hypothetical protein [Porphyromonas levii]
MKQRIFIRWSLLALALILVAPTTEARDRKGRFVVVIDPGHGGKDSGAKGRSSLEKNIVLDVALKTGAKIKALNPNIVIYYTRDNDTFIGLQQRANFANQKKADLFVSIHANSHRTGSPHGAETFVLGLHRTQDNLDVAMKENSAILYEKDHSVTYQDFDPNISESYIIFNFMQNKHLEQSIALAKVVQNGLVRSGLLNRGVKQAGFLVLREVAMPSVLVELGFISNRANENYMRSKEGSQELAQNIAKAVVAYEEKLSGRTSKNTDTPTTIEQQEETTVDTAKATEDDIYYRIQVMADKRRLKRSHFGSYSDVVRNYKEGNIYKYTFYNTTDIREAKRLQKELRKKYKDCFIVGFDANGNKVGSYY